MGAPCSHALSKRAEYTQPGLVGFEPGAQALNNHECPLLLPDPAARRPWSSRSGVSPATTSQRCITEPTLPAARQPHSRRTGPRAACFTIWKRRIWEHLAGRGCRSDRLVLGAPHTGAWLTLLSTALLETFARLVWPRRSADSALRRAGDQVLQLCQADVQPPDRARDPGAGHALTPSSTDVEPLRAMHGCGAPSNTAARP